MNGKLLSLLVAALLFAQTSAAQTAAPSAAPTAADAKAYAKKVNEDLKKLWVRASTAEWIKNTYITDDTERNAAWANEAVLQYLTAAVKESIKYKDVKGLDADTARTFLLLRLATALPAPSDPKKTAELTTIAAKLEGMYGKGKWCGKDGKNCRDLQQLSETIAKSRNYDELLDAWAGWHSISREMKAPYSRLVEIANEGAKEIAFANVGDMWRSGYDMPPEEFEKETDRLWTQVKPLYDDLHCYVRARLAKQYGDAKVPAGKPIPAHLLGNMWAQEWTNIYPLVEPFPGVSNLDISAELEKQKWDAMRMVKLGEAFFTSIGLKPLPKTFFERSMFTKPADRDVVCHASAWDVTYENDLRIKMCIKPTEEDLVTIHHELGHNYYYAYYWQQPVLFQQGANDGFHEAIGDAIALSITPEYYKKVGLLTGEIAKNEKALINQQLKDALERVAFLPFGKLIDQWRWDVYSGKTKPDGYNKAWWDLRKKYQGVDAPIARTEKDFDPGAKYHIPANVPYTRYFLARILQFQFHRAMCKTAGFKGPLHECSIYGNKAAGARMEAMLKLGATKPWPDALAALTGEKQMDATALLDYFAPLQKWLKEQNKDQKCGW